MQARPQEMPIGETGIDHYREGASDETSQEGGVRVAGQDGGGG